MPRIESDVKLDFKVSTFEKKDEQKIFLFLQIQ